jgi:hypothetical protein
VTLRAQDGDAHRAAPTSPYAPTAEVPDRLTLPATLVLVAVALGLAFGGAVLVGTGGSRAKPTTVRGPALVQRAPGSVIDPELRAAPAVPALRVPPRDEVRLQRPTGIARSPARPALTVVSAPVVPDQSARPAPTVVPREAAPSPRRVVAPPKPKPVQTPVPTPESSGDFDTTGEATTEVTDQALDGNRAGATK